NRGAAPVAVPRDGDEHVLGPRRLGNDSAQVDPPRGIAFAGMRTAGSSCLKGACSTSAPSEERTSVGFRGPRPGNARATLLGLPSPERFNEAARGSRMEGLAGAPARAALLHRDVRETEKQSTASESDDFSATHL